MITLKEVRARFARDHGLPFADCLSEQNILNALNEHGIKYRDRVFTPVTTIWGFLSQVLSDDHSCSDAVSRIIAHRAASGLGTCSPNTASYCNARGRIVTGVLRTWRGEPPRSYRPQPRSSGSGSGGMYLSSTGHTSPCRTRRRTRRATHSRRPNRRGSASHSHASPCSCRWRPVPVMIWPSPPTRARAPARRPSCGKCTTRSSRGDVVLADALFDNYFLVCELRERGIDLVARVKHKRAGSKKLQREPDGDVLVWQRPNKPRGMTGEQYRRYPESLTMRQVSVDARDKNNRAKQFKVITTILDPSVDGRQIGSLYEHRWSGEVDIRSIKSTMQMGVLRCKTPEMVHKEIWAHLLAYNMLRTVMAVAAAESGIEPRQVSFKGAKQAVTAFAPKIEAARPKDRPRLIDDLLAVVAYRRVGDRPGRWEPRALKRRPKPVKRLGQPRHVAKLAHNRAKWY